MFKKLLLADDSVTMQKVVELILADEGFEIKAAMNGEEALTIIPSFEPNIILADVDMPKVNGYQLCEKIKQDPSTFHTPVILLVGAFEPFDENLAKQVKADDFLIKPFESKELVGKVYAVLKSTASAGHGVPVTEAVEAEEAPEEDLWEKEEILETEEAGGLSKEEAVVGEEEIFETVEEKEVAVNAGPTETAQPVVKEAITVEEAGINEMELLSKDELKAIFEKSVHDTISSLSSSLDIKEAVLSSLIPLLKDSVEKVVPDLTEKILRESLESPLKSIIEEIKRAIDETVYDLTEKALKEMLKDYLSTLTTEVEKVIWKAVPDVAEAIISKEIERIRSEF